MKHKLKEYRLDYYMARKRLGTLNQLKAAKHHKSVAMSWLNKCRVKLQKEIARVSKEVWPETGRPFIGDWKVVTRDTVRHPLLPGNFVVYFNSLSKCIEFVDRAKYGNCYYITKNQD